jgi:hypothetical protein
VTDPVSWLQIEPGWKVATSDEVIVGEVVEVTGDKHEDIFDGLAVKSEHSGVLYVPGELVGAIYPGDVTLKISSAQTDTLKPFNEPPPQTMILPEKAPLGVRLSTWMRGKR